MIFFIIQGLRTIVFIFILIFPMFRPKCPPDFSSSYKLLGNFLQGAFLYSYLFQLYNQDINYFIKISKTLLLFKGYVLILRSFFKFFFAYFLLFLIFFPKKCKWLSHRNILNIITLVDPVGWGCRIHRLHLCRGVRHPQQVSCFGH